VKNLITIDVVTSSALGFGAGEAAVRPLCLAPVAKVKGTGLPVGGPGVPTPEGTRAPFAGTGTPSLVGVVMEADQVNWVRIPAATAQGVPPRRTPSRC
jgi:hypothetical protein